MKISLSQPKRTNRSGYALILVVVFSALGISALVSSMRWASNTARLTDRTSEYYTAQCAAEAATEKILTHLMKDYRDGGETLVTSRLPAYRAMTPSQGEYSGWTDFEFEDTQSGAASTYVERISQREYVDLDSQYAGLKGYASTFRIISNTGVKGSRHGVKAAVQQDVQLASIPIFQFAIFYNSLLEFTWAAPFTVGGRAHGNGPIYTGSSAPLTFKEDVTSVGVHQKKPWWGFSASSFSGSITYEGIKETNTAALTLPIGTNMTSDAVYPILEAPPANESINSPMGKERLYNKAHMTIVVNPNSTVTTTIKTPYATTGVTLPYSEISYFLTGDSLTDQREGKSMVLARIDVGRFATWVATNSTASAQFGGVNKVRVLHIEDNRSVSSSRMTGIKLANGDQLPEGGLSIATPDPLYVEGHYNCPNPAHRGTTNTSQTEPAALFSDAITVLSENWNDSKSAQSYTQRQAMNTTVNAAILSGIVPSHPSGSSNQNRSGGVMNLTRLLEDWGNGSKKLTINGSIVNLFNSKKATRPFLWPGYYYRAPTRDFNFDNNFLDISKQPPGSPELRVLIRGKWLNPKSGQSDYEG
jgi:hypothetical protein